MTSEQAITIMTANTETGSSGTYIFDTMKIEQSDVNFRVIANGAYLPTIITTNSGTFKVSQRIDISVNIPEIKVSLNGDNILNLHNFYP